MARKNAHGDRDNDPESTSVGPYDIPARLQALERLRSDGQLDALEQTRAELAEIVDPPETFWAQWITDWAGQNKSQEDMDMLYAKAVASSPTVAVWSRYVEFLMTTPLYDTEHKLELMSKAVSETEYSIPDSHKVWNLYIDYLKESLDLSQQTSILAVEQSYKARLAVVHTEIETTFSDFSSFVTQYDNARYESILSEANATYSETLKILRARDQWELALLKDPSPDIFSQYINWEKSRAPKKGPSAFNVNAVSALYRRALVHYGHIPEVWDDYILWLSLNQSADAFDAASRAVRRCPLSGNLWAHKLRLTQAKTGDDPEALLEVKASFDNIDWFTERGSYYHWKPMAIAWISCLKAINADGMFTDDLLNECDDCVQRILREGKGDNQWDLGRVIVFIKDSLAPKPTVQSVWKRLSRPYRRLGDFWLSWHRWELSNGDVVAAGNVLDQALDVRNMDWPGPIYAEMIIFNQLHRTGFAAQQALSIVRQKMQTLSLAQNIPQKHDLEQHDTEDALEPVEKRMKSDYLMDTEDSADTGPRSVARDNAEQASEHTSASRDREHLSVKVSGLPSNATKEQVVQFFKSCGDIRSVLIERTHGNTTGVVEFSSEDEVKSALTRDMKELTPGGPTVSVRRAAELTVWVTNFPARYTQDDIRELFSSAGNVLDVRLPSLKFNAKRKFCYVQFSDSRGSHKAVADFDGKEIDGEKLVVKVSDPSQKQSRSGALEERREIIVKGIDYRLIGQKELEQLFAKHGEIEHINLAAAREENRLHAGFGFITYRTRNQAESALAENGTRLGKQTLRVAIAEKIAKTAPHVLGQKKDSISPAEIKAKTVCVENVADTVREEQLRELMEMAGPLHKIIMKPALNGAIVEYQNVSDAGKASLELDGKELVGRPIKFVDSLRPPPSSRKVTSFVPRMARRR